MRDCPFSAIYWLSFESCRKHLAESHPGVLLALPAPLVTFGSGVASGLLAASLTHPFDVLKTQAQVICVTTTIACPCP